MNDSALGASSPTSSGGGAATTGGGSPWGAIIGAIAGVAISTGDEVKQGYSIDASKYFKDGLLTKGNYSEIIIFILLAIVLVALLFFLKK